ncbi:MAG TPA: DEAD/DEAH box helicase, partial [Bdellovibrio sp.]|nr:DEAD/DEAH box helicase [Bdellovibrio sp.]
MTPPLTTVTPPDNTLNFENFGLSTSLLEAMKDMGFSTPTPIQQQALPLLLTGANDFIGLASTGTGKTAAFGIPLVEAISTTTKDTQALVLSPTRELALQVAEQLTLLGKKKGLRVVTIYG